MTFETTTLPRPSDEILNGMFAKLPAVAAGAGKKLTPGARVTVTGEEHYQDTLAKYEPAKYETVVLAQLLVAENDPWAAKPTGPRVEVRVDGQTVGFLTAAMTTRHLPMIDGPAVFAEASVQRDRKSGRLEVTLSIFPPGDLEVTPTEVANSRTGTRHKVKSEQPDGFGTNCGITVRTGEAVIFGKTKPWCGWYEYETGLFFDVPDGPPPCHNC